MSSVTHAERDNVVGPPGQDDEATQPDDERLASAPGTSSQHTIAEARGDEAASSSCDTYGPTNPSVANNVHASGTEASAQEPLQEATKLEQQRELEEVQEAAAAVAAWAEDEAAAKAAALAAESQAAVPVPAPAQERSKAEPGYVPGEAQRSSETGEAPSAAPAPAAASQAAVPAPPPVEERNKAEPGSKKGEATSATAPEVAARPSRTQSMKEIASKLLDAARRAQAAGSTARYIKAPEVKVAMGFPFAERNDVLVTSFPKLSLQMGNGPRSSRKSTQQPSETMSDTLHSNQLVHLKEFESVVGVIVGFFQVRKVQCTMQLYVAD